MIFKDDYIIWDVFEQAWDYVVDKDAKTSNSSLNIMFNKKLNPMDEIMSGMEEVNRKYQPFKEGWEDNYEK